MRKSPVACNQSLCLRYRHGFSVKDYPRPRKSLVLVSFFFHFYDRLMRPTDGRRYLLDRASRLIYCFFRQPLAPLRSIHTFVTCATSTLGLRRHCDFQPANLRAPVPSGRPERRRLSLQREHSAQSLASMGSCRPPAFGSRCSYQTGDPTAICSSRGAAHGVSTSNFPFEERRAALNFVGTASKLPVPAALPWTPVPDRIVYSP